jgi:allantoin racemase
MKILCQFPLQVDMNDPGVQACVGLILRDTQAVKRPDTELVMNPLSRGMTDFEDLSHLGRHFLNDRNVMNCALEGVEREGDIDGVIVNCYFDPALRATKQALDVPVVGLAESAMHLASLAGRKFAVLVGDRRYVAKVEETIKEYDMRAKAIDHKPVRSFDISELDGFAALAQGDLALVVGRVTEVARGCIEDGADTVIIGCGIFAVLLSEGARLKEIDGVPVVNPITSAVKFIELLVDLEKSGVAVKSRKGLYWKEGQPALACVA